MYLDHNKSENNSFNPRTNYVLYSVIYFISPESRGALGCQRGTPFGNRWTRERRDWQLKHDSLRILV